MKNIILTNLIVLFISLFVSLLCGEFLIRIIAPQNLSGSWFVETDNGLVANKSNGSANAQLGKRNVLYHFYEPHLRDTPIKDKGIKILAVGDSFTFGMLLNKEDTYINHLQNYIDNEFGNECFQLLNGAAGGWGASSYAAFIEDFGPIIKPEIVLVFINTDDIGRSITKPIYTFDEAGKLKRNILKTSTLKKIVNSIYGYQWLLAHSHLIQIVRASIIKFGQPIHNPQTVKTEKKLLIAGPMSNIPGISRDYAIKLGQAIFKRIKKWCDENNAELIITTTGWHNLNNADISLEPTKAFMSHSSTFFNSIGASFFDISTFVSKYKTIDMIIPDDGHPNEAGSKLIADSAWKLFIKDQLYKYCQKTAKCCNTE